MIPQIILFSVILATYPYPSKVAEDAISTAVYFGTSKRDGGNTN